MAFTYDSNLTPQQNLNNWATSLYGSGGIGTRSAAQVKADLLGGGLNAITFDSPTSPFSAFWNAYAAANAPVDPMQGIAKQINETIQGGALNPGATTQPITDFQNTLTQLFGSGGAGGQLMSQLNNLIGSATGGTINEYNTAANRLRERTDAATRAAQNQFTNQRLSQGFGASGFTQRGLGNLAMQGAGNYAQGLASLANDFEGQRQQGIQSAVGVGNSLSNLLGTQVNAGTQLANTAANINSQNFLGKLSSLSNILAGIFNRSGN